MSAQNLVLALSSPEATVARAGGKGHNLARLIAGGFPVPDGFVVTTDAYRAFVDVNGGAALTAIPGGVDPDDIDALENVAAQIRARFEAGSVPQAVADAIGAAYEKLGGEACAVAVRSSATAEDLADLSFAGQQETYLNIVGRAALLEAVVRCWASLWTARAISYRARARFADEALSLAVVVQRLVPSEVSGVLFTANPLTGHRGQIVIDASFGLGEAVVSGQVEPDHFVVDTASFRIEARHLGEKAMAIVPKAGGGTEHREAEGAGASLEDGEVIELARLAKRVAQHFGAPQDIEWARAGGRLHLLQSRPITSLYPLPAGVDPEGKLRAFFNFNSFQGFPEPFTPFGGHALHLIMRGMTRAVTGGATGAEVAGGRLFKDMSPALRHPLVQRLMLKLLSNADPAAVQSFRKLIDAGRFGEREGFALGTWLSLARFWPPKLARMAATLAAPERMRARATAEVDEFVTRARANASAAPHLPALLDALEADCEAAGPSTLMRTGPVFMPAMLLMHLLDRWLEARLGFERGTGLRFARGVPGNVTTEMDLELWALAQAVRADGDAATALRTRDAAELAESYREGALPEVLQRGLQAFLDRYGARAVAEIDPGRPRWRDDPTPVLHTLAGYLELEDPARAPDAVFAAGAREAEKLAAQCVARAAEGPLGFVRAPLVGGAVRRIRLLLGLREYHKFAMVQVLDAYRGALRWHGHELQTRGVIAREEDVFFLLPEELGRIAGGEWRDLKPRVAERRAEYERERNRRQIPRVMLSTGEVFYEGMSARAGKGDLHGEGVSPGTVEGVVRVVRDPRGVRLLPGEILVCPATDPGWTPLFLSASGLVMEMGGMMTHGSVVAREYGLPAVVGVHQGTTRLRDGQRIRVDGTHGVITLLEAAGA